DDSYEVFFFQAEDGIRDRNVTGVQTCALPISPFDKNVIQDVEKAIQESDLGLNPNNRGDAIYITVPPLTDERRRELVRAVKNLRSEERRVGKVRITRLAPHT